jgi:hypothetical protein
MPDSRHIGGFNDCGGVAYKLSGLIFVQHINCGAVGAGKVISHMERYDRDKEQMKIAVVFA